MKILYIAHRIPYPPNKGDKIRSCNTIKHLARRHRVWCACFVDNEDDFRHVECLRRYCQEVVALPLKGGAARLRALFELGAGGSGSEGFYRQRGMAEALVRLSARVRFDAALVFSSGMGQYADCVAAPRKVLDMCDLDSRKWAECASRAIAPMSWLYAAEARRLGELEKKLCRRFEATVLIGAHEAHGWRGADEGELHFVGNGVELPSLGAASHDSGVVGFVGDMSYYPNEDAMCWFARRVWPQVRGAVPAARLEIVGRRPSRALRRLERLEGVRVVGQVEDVVEHLLRFQVVIAPLRIARGLQNKVLEAMAAGRAVVASSAAACGIDAIDGRHLVVADEAQDFAQHVRHLLDNPDVCRDLGESARRQMAIRYDWSEQLSPLEDLLQGVQHTAFVSTAQPIPATI